MNSTDINTFTFTEEQKKELQQHFRECLEYIETFEGIRVFTNTVMTFVEDLFDMATGYATQFDVDGNGSVEPIIILSKTALTSPYKAAILWHEHGHHALGHLDGNTEDYVRNTQHECEADMWSYIHVGEDMLQYVKGLKESLSQLYSEGPSEDTIGEGAKNLSQNPEEAIKASLDAQNEALYELDARIASLLNGGDISSLNQVNNGETEMNTTTKTLGSTPISFFRSFQCTEEQKVLLEEGKFRAVARQLGQTAWYTTWYTSKQPFENFRWLKDMPFESEPMVFEVDLVKGRVVHFLTDDANFPMIWKYEDFHRAVYFDPRINSFMCTMSELLFCPHINKYRSGSYVEWHYWNVNYLEISKFPFEKISVETPDDFPF